VIFYRTKTEISSWTEISLLLVGVACSKEPSLEDKIQNSLRENLKEIGHRCIQEMRDFIERLKEEDIDDV